MIATKELDGKCYRSWERINYRENVFRIFRIEILNYKLRSIDPDCWFCSVSGYEIYESHDFVKYSSIGNNFALGDEISFKLDEEILIEDYKEAEKKIKPILYDSKKIITKINSK